MTATRGSNDTTSSYDLGAMTPTQKAAAAVGAVFLLVGILGFILA
jgi:hypothetical protein